MTADKPKDALASLAEGIALLIDLAKRGEIDPWDVRVIDVIDRYLSQLTPGTHARSNNQFAELSQSGQAFLYASMLVLLKADSLMAEESADEEGIAEEMEFFEGEDGEGGLLRPQHLERQLRRRAVAKVPQKRQVTLQELIEQLQLMATTIAQRQSRPRPRRSTTRNKSQTAKAIAELAHQENLVEMAGQLDELLRAQGLNPGGDWLDLEQLLVLWSNLTAPKQLPPSESSPEPDHTPHKAEPKHDRVGVFWALLLLSAQSKVELSQEEFYQDIKVRTLPVPQKAELNAVRK